MNLKEFRNVNDDFWEIRNLNSKTYMGLSENTSLELRVKCYREIEENIMGLNNLRMKGDVYIWI